MGTRSLTVFNNERGEEIVVLYRQYDGYPEGHGADLARILEGGVLVNGIRLDEDRKIFNGMGDLAMRVIAELKAAQRDFPEDKARHGSVPGGFYLYPAGTRDAWEEYIYFISPAEHPEKIAVKVVAAPDEVLYEGDVEGFVSFVAGVSA